MEPWDSLFAISIAASGIFPGHLLHESSHWLIGKLAASDPKPMWKKVFGRRVWPTGIEHGNIDEISGTAIQMSGAIPIIWLLVTLLLAAAKLSTPHIINTLPTAIQILTVSTTFAASVGLTESDITALFNPDEFRKRQKQNELSRNWGWPILIRRTLNRNEKSNQK